MKLRFILAGATLALTSAVAVAQSTAKPSPYEGTAQPPASDVIRATGFSSLTRRSLPPRSCARARPCGREADSVCSDTPGSGRKSRLRHRRSAGHHRTRRSDRNPASRRRGMAAPTILTTTS